MEKRKLYTGMLCAFITAGMFFFVTNSSNSQVAGTSVQSGSDQVEGKSAGTVEEFRLDQQMEEFLKEPKHPNVYYTIDVSGEKHEIKKLSADEASRMDEESSLNADVSQYDAPTGTVELRPECTSEGTSWTGARRSCTSGWSVVNAPPNYVFNEHSIAKSYTGKNGSENRIDHEWLNYVEVVPGTGIVAPTTLRTRVHARSPECRGCRGWSKARVTAVYVKYR